MLSYLFFRFFVLYYGKASTLGRSEVLLCFTQEILDNSKLDMSAVTLANNEDTDERPYNAVFHQCLHCLLRQTRSEKQIQYFVGNYNI